MALVMPVTVPVKAGLARGAFRSRAVWVADETGLLASAVLSALPRPTMPLVTPVTVPVKVGLARGAFRSRADWVAVETGLAVSAVLSTLPRPRLPRAAALSARSPRLLAAFRLPVVVALKAAKSVAAR